MMSGNFDAAGYRGLTALLNGVVIGRWTMDPPVGWVKTTFMGYQRKEFTFVAPAATATLDLQCMFDNTYAGAVVDAMRLGLVLPTPLPTPAPFACPNGALGTYTNITDPPTVSVDGRISNYSVGGVLGLEAQLVPSLARYVRFWKTPSEYDASTIYINIAEVAVYAAGDMATNVALNKGVASSSVYAHPFYAPAQLTDGLTTTTYSNGAHTDDANPWVEVDLQQNTPIALIVMWPRPDAASRSFNMNVQLLADGTRAIIASFKLPSSFNPSPPRAMYQARVCASPSPSQTASSTATSSVTGSLTASSSLTPSASQVSATGGPQPVAGASGVLKQLCLRGACTGTRAPASTCTCRRRVCVRPQGCRPNSLALPRLRPACASPLAARRPRRHRPPAARRAPLPSAARRRWCVL
jgi:hypothetical protein